MSNGNDQYEIVFDRVKNSVGKHTRHATAHILVKRTATQRVFNDCGDSILDSSAQGATNPRESFRARNSLHSAIVDFIPAALGFGGPKLTNPPNVRRCQAFHKNVS